MMSLAGVIGKAEQELICDFAETYTLKENLNISDADIVQKTINKYFDGDIFKSTKDLKEHLSAYGSTSYASFLFVVWQAFDL